MARDGIPSYSRATGGGGVADRVLAQLLTELDGVGGQAGAGKGLTNYARCGMDFPAGVVLIAATNRPWAMDAALLRPGRIDRLVHVPLPDSDARGKIWRGALAKVASIRACFVSYCHRPMIPWVGAGTTCSER